MDGKCGMGIGDAADPASAMTSVSPTSIVVADAVGSAATGASAVSGAAVVSSDASVATGWEESVSVGAPVAAVDSGAGAGVAAPTTESGSSTDPRPAKNPAVPAPSADAKA